MCGSGGRIRPPVYGPRRIARAGRGHGSETDLRNVRL
nr:MAG TPA: hypothetical protein [Bacteriophage sp.]